MPTSLTGSITFKCRLLTACFGMDLSLRMCMSQRQVSHRIQKRLKLSTDGRQRTTFTNS